MTAPLTALRFGTLYVFRNPHRAQSVAIDQSGKEPKVTMAEPRFDEFRAQMKKDHPSVFVGRNYSYTKIYVSTGRGPNAELDLKVEAAISALGGFPSKPVRDDADSAANGAIQTITAPKGVRRWFVADTAALGYYFDATGTKKAYTDPITDDKQQLNPAADAQAAAIRAETDQSETLRSPGPGTLNRGPGGGRRRNRSGKTSS